MILRRAISIFICTVFMISGIAVFYSSPAEGQSDYVDSIEISVHTNRTAVLEDVATGDLDVCINTISGQTYEDLKESWKEKLGLWISEETYYNLYFNTAHEPDTDYKYLCNVSGELRFNPFAVRKVRYAMNFLVNRKKICEEFGDGFAEPRYLWVSSKSQVYRDELKEIVDEHGLTPSGEKQKGLDMVHEALSDITLTEGELRPPSNSSADYWQYKAPEGNWTNVTTEGFHRPEDWRLEIGDHVAGLLEDAGIKVNINTNRRTSMVQTVFDGDPSDLEWGYYTGGWLTRGNRYYPEYSGIQMYLPSYFRSWVNVPQHYYMYENQTLERLAEDLDNGRINSEEEYWDKLEKMADVGLKESLRVFLATEISFYAYYKDEVAGAATDSITGWSDFFTPRTIRTSNGSMKAGFYRSEDEFFMENWNKYGGSGGDYGNRQRKMVHDVGSWDHIVSGKPLPVRTDWQGEKGEVIIDYKWDDEKLTKNVEIPSDAVVYNTLTQRWEQVGSGLRSAVKVTYDVVEGKWHDGHDLTVRDVMAQYALDKDMVFEDNRTNDHFHEVWSGGRKPWYEDIIATEWNADEGTYTIYGDYTFPQEHRVGQYYSKFPILPYQVYEAAGNLVAGTDLATGMDEYAWDSGGTGNWVHWLSESQGQDFKSVLQNMKDQDWRPPYVKSENNSPIPISQSEYESQIDSIISFYDQYKHFYDSNGPFKLAEYDSEQQTMSLDRFTKAEGYPWSEGHWSFTTAEMKIDTIEAPEQLNIGESFSVNITAHIDEDRAVREEDDANVTVKLINSSSGQVVDEVNDPQLKVGDNSSTYEAVFSTEGLPLGDYQVRAEGKLPGQAGSSVKSTNLTLVEDTSDGEDNNTDDGGNGKNGDDGIPGFAVTVLLPVIIVLAIYRWRRENT